MKKILAEEKIQLEKSRSRFVALRLAAIAKRNEYQTTLLGDLIGSLDHALWNINYELGTTRRKF